MNTAAAQVEFRCVTEQAEPERIPGYGLTIRIERLSADAVIVLLPNGKALFRFGDQLPASLRKALRTVFVNDRSEQGVEPAGAISVQIKYEPAEPVVADDQAHEAVPSQSVQMRFELSQSESLVWQWLLGNLQRDDWQKDSPQQREVAYEPL